MDHSNILLSGSAFLFLSSKLSSYIIDREKEEEGREKNIYLLPKKKKKKKKIKIKTNQKIKFMNLATNSFARLAMF